MRDTLMLHGASVAFPKVYLWDTDRCYEQRAFGSWKIYTTELPEVRFLIRKAPQNF